MGEYYLRRAIANVDGREIRNLRMAFKVEKTLKSHPKPWEIFWARRVSARSSTL